jgi:hypothetical protein
MEKLSQAAIGQANQLERYLSYQRTWAYEHYVRRACAFRKVGLFTGNQGFKTSSTAYQYGERIFGTHPVPKRNVLYFECPQRDKDNMAPHGYFMWKTAGGDLVRLWEKGTYGIMDLPKDGLCKYCGKKLRIHRRKSRIFRFASENLPTEKETIAGDSEQSAEIKNAQYPEFKKWLPPFLIKKDITVRNPAITIIDPNVNMRFGDLEYTGADIIVEFVSYSQQVQAGAGVQRMSCWCDEHAPFDFYEEQVPRLIAEDGDLIFSVTPAMGMSWEYDQIFEKAKLYIRTDAICRFYKDFENKKVANIEVTDSSKNIAVIQAATDDNPTLSLQVIEEMYGDIADPDGTVIPTRRYGIFKQAIGRIFKDFNYRVHIIDPKKYKLTSKVISEWVKGRTFDYHPANPHAIIWVALSPFDEAFVYMEWGPSPDKMVIEEVAKGLVEKSGDDKFIVDLVDPLIKGTRTKDDRGRMKDGLEILNRKLMDLKHDGKGSGGYFNVFSTKGTEGRDEIKKRLKNALKCKKPFNNEVTVNGVPRQLPTLWIFNECRQTARSLKHWSMETWANNRQLVTKDRKETPQQRHSHYCTALEGLFKERRFRPKRNITRNSRTYTYFKGGI